MSRGTCRRVFTSALLWNWRFGSEAGSCASGGNGGIALVHRLVRKAGVLRLIVNVSYATDALAPQDADLVILPGLDYPKEQPCANDQELKWPFLHGFVAADEDDLEAWAIRDFGTGRQPRPKGVVEVIL